MQRVLGFGELVDEVARVGPDVEVVRVVLALVGQGRPEGLLFRGGARGVVAVSGRATRGQRVERDVGRPLAPRAGGGEGGNGGGVLRAETEQPRLDSGMRGYLGA